MQYRVVTVTPAGRKRYLAILVPYLLRNRTHIAEHHWWVNTRDAADVEYLEELAAQYPTFFKLDRRTFYNVDQPTVSIWQYFRDCVDEDTIYVRLDDDICYVAPDAIHTLTAYRATHRDPFLVLGNIVNNAICSYYQQQTGLLSAKMGNCAEGLHGRGWLGEQRICKEGAQTVLARLSERKDGAMEVRRATTRRLCPLFNQRDLLARRRYEAGANRSE